MTFYDCLLPFWMLLVSLPFYGSVIFHSYCMFSAHTHTHREHSKCICTNCISRKTDAHVCSHVSNVVRANQFFFAIFGEKILFTHISVCRIQSYFGTYAKVRAIHNENETRHDQMCIHNHCMAQAHSRKPATVYGCQFVIGASVCVCEKATFKQIFDWRFRVKIATKCLQ